jgi:hypothetical protein
MRSEMSKRWGRREEGRSEMREEERRMGDSRNDNRRGRGQEQRGRTNVDKPNDCHQLPLFSL